MEREGVASRLDHKRVTTTSCVRNSWEKTASFIASPTLCSQPRKGACGTNDVCLLKERRIERERQRSPLARLFVRNCVVGATHNKQAHTRRHRATPSHIRTKQRGSC